MNLDTSLAPRFVIFHYFINWFIQNIGSTAYFIGIVGGLGSLCAYAFNKSIKSKEWDRAIMVAIFSCILIGGLIGFGLDIINGHTLDPLSY